MFIQAGGHQLIKVVDDNKCVVKPTKNKELKFYQKTLLNSCPELKPYVPKFYSGGRIENMKHLFSEAEYDIIKKKRYKRFIKVENLLNRIPLRTENIPCDNLPKIYEEPNNITIMNDSSFIIIDIKLGKIHWKSCASQENIIECQRRNLGSTMDNYAIRLDGFAAKQNGQINRLTKEECRLFTIEKIKEVLSVLTDEDKLVVSDWLKDLSRVLEKSKVNIYGPSILILKETNGMMGDIGCSSNSSNINVKLIDFTTYEKCDQFKFSKKVKVLGALTKKEAKRMRKFLIQDNKIDMLHNMHNDILVAIDSLINLLN